jgi:hypothetical protein
MHDNRLHIWCCSQDRVATDIELLPIPVQDIVLSRQLHDAFITMGGSDEIIDGDLKDLFDAFLLEELEDWPVGIQRIHIYHSPLEF